MAKTTGKAQAKPKQAEAQPLLATIDARLKQLERPLARHKSARRAYVAAQEALAKAKREGKGQTGFKAEMDKHREGYRAHRRAENERRALRKQRAALYPDS